MELRVVSGGPFTSNGRWVVVEGEEIVYDPLDLYGYPFDLREREQKLRGPGPPIDWEAEPEERGLGTFDLASAAESLGACLSFRRRKSRKEPE